VTLSPHFTVAELTRTSTGLPNDPPPFAVTRLCVLAWALEGLRSRGGDVPLQVTSGFRSLQVNRAIGGASGSAHLTGLAADIKPAAKMRDWLQVVFAPPGLMLAAGLWQELCIETTSEGGCWLHCELMERPGVRTGRMAARHNHIGIFGASMADTWLPTWLKGANL